MTVVAILLILLILLLIEPQEKRGAMFTAYVILGGLGAGLWYVGPFVLGLGITLFDWIRDRYGLFFAVLMTGLALFSAAGWGLIGMCKLEMRSYKQ